MIVAFVKDEIIENLIEAELDTPFHVLFPDVDEFVVFTETSGIPRIGLQCKQGKFQPYASWTWDADAARWVAPSPEPETASYWDEDSLSWVGVPDGSN